MDIQKIQSQFSCPVIGPGDTEYDKTRTVLPGDIDHKPAVIIRVENNHDIADAIALARTSKLPLSVRSGGHSAAGLGVVDGGVVIDVRNLKKLEIDKKNKTVYSESGLTAIEVTTALDKENFVLGFGDTGSVGIGGITLGVGVGYLVIKYGLAIDNLLSADLITADGKAITASEKNNPDLFWAIRGGGGNFGVATGFTYAVHELGDVYGGMLLLPATPQTISGLLEIFESAPDELSGIANIMPTPPMPAVGEEFHGKISIMCLLMYAGDPTVGETFISKIKNLATPIADMTKKMRYKDIFFPDDESYHPLAIAKNFFMDNVDNTSASTILDSLNATDASMRVVQLRVLGGQFAKVSSDATAFAHRQKKIMVNVASFYDGSEDKQKRKLWVDDVSTKLSGGQPGAYVAFLGPGEQNRILEAYPQKTYDRLVAVKRTFDPQNIFTGNFNIKP